ncbi:MAG: hypothetical protein U0414_42195 [Polyangiaceae bacterium]
MLERTPPGTIALDELAEHALSATFSLSRREDRARLLRRRPAWLTSQTAMGAAAAAVVLVLLLVMMGRRMF